MKKTLLLLLFLIVCNFSWGQKVNDHFSLHIDKTSEEITIDGILDEDTWKQTDVAKNFFMIQPTDNRPATQHSEARMAFDENNLYISVIFYNNATKGAYNVESLKRDFSFNGNENLILAIDPFNNLTTGFTFGLNAYGAQWDGTLSNGGRADLNWDTKWVSEVQFDEDKWVCEMAIPFKSIRYKEGISSWGINFSRLDLKANEKSAWAPVPRQFPSVSLAYTGNLIWDTPPPSQKKNVSVIPYVASFNSNEDQSFQAGADVKIGIGAALNLDLTINPDFSNTEVDQEVTNLNRFELFFPEKRQFFLENADLFANYGSRNIKPFFSRRIGLGVPIEAGMRLSGNLNENLRIGAMDIQTQADLEQGLPKENYAVVSLQQKVLDRSSIGLIMVNKQAINFNPELHTESEEYNRSLGLEYNFASTNNQWEGKALYLKTFTPENPNDALVFLSDIGFQNRKWNLGLGQEYVGENVYAAVGFIPRVNYRSLKGNVDYTFYPIKEGNLVSHGPKIFRINFYDDAGNNTDYFMRSGYVFNFLNRSRLDFTLDRQYVQLLDPFDPIQTGKGEIEAGTTHRWSEYGFKYSSKPSSLFTYSVEGITGGFYLNGKKTELNTQFGYRFQPYVSLSTVFNRVHIDLAAPWNSSDFWLIGAKANITFTKNLFFSNYYQYNQQFNRWGINSRLQWRYKPASDVFLVFNTIENNGLEPYSGWNLSLKATYWFNN